MVHHIAINTLRPQIHACGQDDSPAVIHGPGICLHADHTLFKTFPADFGRLLNFRAPAFSRLLQNTLRQDLRNLPLADRQMIRILQDTAHLPGIILLVRLGP